MRNRNARQSGQVLVIVAVWLLALIGSAALVLLVGSVEWQRNQVQQLADQAALDAALKIGVGCNAGSANTVITEADNFLATQRTRTGSLSIAAGTCATPYTGTDTFAGSLSETVHYPYRAHQQQVEVILTVSLPISFGGYLGATNTNVTRRAVAQQLNGSTAAVSSTTLSCTGGQFNVGGSVVASNAISLIGACAVYAHDRFDAASGTYSDLGNVSVYANGQAWVGGGGSCLGGAIAGSVNSVCADGYERSGHTATSCGTSGTSAFLAFGDAAVNPNPCAAGTAPLPVAPLATTQPPDPNTDSAITATLPGAVPCSAAAVYPSIVVNGVTVGSGNAAAPTQDGSGYVHFKSGCYGYLDLGNLGSSSSISLRQTGAEISGVDHFISPTLPAASTAGTLLVATLMAQDGLNTITPPAGWILAANAQQAGEGWNQIWYYPTNPGGITTATWTVVPANIDVAAQLTEWNGAAAAPFDQSGTFTLGPPGSTIAAVATLATATPNELVITSDGFKIAAGQTFTQGAAYTPLVHDVPNGAASEYHL
ncbi:MAG TPA: pilus assembly protein TadG-related protein, partial [Candidatus Dormibacteraeota bacterium]|nr:pilus assembly protein TadG-related protein [Candidatus Dormibacteraeota bacterium]